LVGQFAEHFPQQADHLPGLVDMFFDSSLALHDSIGRPTMRSLGGGGGNVGGTKYNMNVYLRERGDANIQTLTDMIEKANHWDDPAIDSRTEGLQRADSATTLVSSGTLQTRFAIQTIVLQTFAEHRLDAVVYPRGNFPPAIITSPE
jgi:amidase